MLIVSKVVAGIALVLIGVSVSGCGGGGSPRNESVVVVEGSVSGRLDQVRCSQRGGGDLELSLTGGARLLVQVSVEGGVFSSIRVDDTVSRKGLRVTETESGEITFTGDAVTFDQLVIDDGRGQRAELRGTALCQPSTPR